MVEYLRRLKAAIDYIDSNLDADDLTVSNVASQVGYSAFHFHRVFSGATGESVTEYIRKRRLAEAGAKLVGAGELSIGQIATEAGFESQEAFTRAFKKMYSVTPRAYRKGERAVPIAIAQTFSIEFLEHLKGGITMEPEFCEREKELAVGVGGSFKIGDFREISKLWKEFDKRSSEIESAGSGYSLGVCMDSHPDIEVGEGDQFVYLACLPVKSLEKVPAGMHGVELPAGKYAVFTHKGSIATITQTVHYIWGTWVPKHSDILKKGPDFELYDSRFDPHSLEGEVDIYIPLA